MQQAKVRVVHRALFRAARGSGCRPDLCFEFQTGHCRRWVHTLVTHSIRLYLWSALIAHIEMPWKFNQNGIDPSCLAVSLAGVHRGCELRRGEVAVADSDKNWKIRDAFPTRG